MVLSEVDFEGIVVDVVLRLSAAITTITQMASFVAITTMREQLVIAIEALATETTLRVTLKTRLVLSTRNIVSVLLVSTQFLRGE